MSSLAISNSIVSAFFWMLSFLSTTLMSHTARSSQSQTETMSEKLSTSLIIATVFSISLSCLIVFSTDFLFSLYKVSSQHEHETLLYLYLRLMSLPFALFCSCANGVFRGLQSFKVQLYLALILTSTNILISSALVVLYGQAVLGCGIGTLVSFIMTAAYSFHLLYKNHKIHICSPSKKFFQDDFWSLQKDSFNVFLRTSSLVASLWLMTLAVSRLHPTALAAHQIQLQVWLFASFIMDGLAVTATALCGQAHKLHDQKTFTKIAKKFINMSYFIGFIYGAMCLLSFQPIASLFTHNTQIHEFLKQPWYLMASLQCIGAAVYLFDGLLYAQGEFSFMRKRMIEAFFFIYLPSLYLLQNSFLGIWAAFSGLILYRFISSKIYFSKILNTHRAGF